MRENTRRSTWRLVHLRKWLRRTTERPHWAQAATAIAALGALVLTSLSLVLASFQNAHQNSIAEQGQITQRYTATINQLGSNIEDVRLGGIYALQRIMENSPVDQPTIVSVLCAFIRNHPPGHPQATRVSRPPTDIDAALTVLSNRNTGHDGYASIDLRNTDFSYTSLASLQLTNANLTLSNLTGADLGHAVLAGARLGNAKLTKANLYYANLAGATVVNADLTGAELFGANLTKARFGSAKLAEASLQRADLTEASLNSADLTKAKLAAANLTKADLLGAKLAGANLTEASLQGAEFGTPGFAGADLTGASFARTSLCAGAQPTDPSRGYTCEDPSPNEFY